MNSRSFLLAVPVVLFSSGALFVLTRESTAVAAGTGLASRADQESERATSADKGPDKTEPLRDQPTEPFRRELLDFAFNAASAIPSMPHIKTRARAQEGVVVASFELHQPSLALRYIEEIDNWRRGAAYADVAFYLAAHGCKDLVLRYLDRAREYVERMDLQDDELAGEVDDEAIEGFQSWRRDRIRAKIARTYLLLGELDKAAEFAQGLEASESGVVELVRAKTMDASDLELHGQALEAVAGEGNLERVRNALSVGVELLDRFYADAEKRALLEPKLRACLAKSPAFFRIEFLMSMASAVLDHGDRTRALELVKEVEGILGENRFAPEDGIPLAARLAVLRHRAGDEAIARKQVDTAREHFQAERARIENLVRAETLVPIAEAYRSMGDSAAALEVYRQAVADGAENQNGVPRADDLCATLCSMARNGIAPDPELWQEIRSVHAGLREPW